MRVRILTGRINPLFDEWVVGHNLYLASLRQYPTQLRLKEYHLSRLNKSVIRPLLYLITLLLHMCTNKINEFETVLMRSSCDITRRSIICGIVHHFEPEFNPFTTFYPTVHCSSGLHLHNNCRGSLFCKNLDGDWKSNLFFN